MMILLILICCLLFIIMTTRRCFFKEKLDLVLCKGEAYSVALSRDHARSSTLNFVRFVK